MRTALGPVELIIIIVVGAFVVLSWVVSLWGIVDAALQPKSSWVRAGHNQVLWIALIAASAFICIPVGLILSIAYFAAIRPLLRAE